MTALTQKSIRWQRLFYPLFLLAAAVYILFHALNGNYGLYAYLVEQRRAEKLTSQYQTLQDQRKSLDNRVKSLSDNSLDLDLLDERARVVLGYGNKDERVHLVEPEKDAAR